MSDEDRDLGQPIAELRDLVIEPDEGFRRRVRKKIERRRLAGSTFDFAIPALASVVRELLEFVFGRTRGGTG